MRDGRPAVDRPDYEVVNARSRKCPRVEIGFISSTTASLEQQTDQVLSEARLKPWGDKWRRHKTASVCPGMPSNKQTPQQATRDKTLARQRR